MTICIVCIMAVLPDQLPGVNIPAWQQHAIVGQD
jgi:hypothetical protein